MIKQLKATHEGELKIGEKILSCAVLEDNTRVLTATAVFQAFNRTRKGKSSEDYRVDHMPSFLNANNLQPFIGEEVTLWTRIVHYIGVNGAPRTGYDARVLRGMCRVYIDARNAGVLKSNQERLATEAEILLYALSDVGITALVDEATGYQYSRERDELQKILKAYITEGLLKWEKRFPDEYYRLIFRLHGWDYTIKDIRKRPGVIGKWTKELIYEQLPQGVLEELERVTPRSASGNHTARLHQSLTPDIGHPHLSAQINRVIALMKVSENWQNFMHLFNRMVADSGEGRPVSGDMMISPLSKASKDTDRFEGDLFDGLTLG